jgi:DNA-binding response OmpR family regulator
MAPRRVLVVDDSMELGRMVQAALATLALPVQVTLVPSAEEAQLEFSRHSFDLLITDVRLPGISGLELTRRLRTRHKAVRIIQISGLTDTTLRQQSLEAGADVFFTKPLDMPVFLETAEKLLASRKTGPLASQAGAAQAATAADRVSATAGSRASSQADRLAEFLSVLRQSLGAQGVALLDDHGHPLFHDGEIPDRELDAGIWGSLMSTLTAGERVALYLGNRVPESVYIFRGQVFNFVVSPLGGAFVVLLVFRSVRSTIRLSIASDEILIARKELEKILAEMGVAVHPPQGSARSGDGAQEFASALRPPTDKLTPAPEPVSETGPLPAPVSLEKSAPAGPAEAAPAPAEPSLAEQLAQAPVDEKMAADLDKLMNEASQDKATPVDASSFWDTLIEKDEIKPPLSPDELTYEQARQMGLAPEDLNP